MPCCAQGQQELGNAWKEIAKRLPGRGRHDCRDRFNDTSSMKRLRLAAGEDSARSDGKNKIASKELEAAGGGEEERVHRVRRDWTPGEVRGGEGGGRGGGQLNHGSCCIVMLHLFYVMSSNPG